MWTELYKSEVKGDFTYFGIIEPYEVIKLAFDIKIKNLVFEEKIMKMKISLK